MLLLRGYRKCIAKFVLPPLDGLRPLVLDMKEIQKILGISRTTAYKLVHTEGFPAFRSGSNIKVSKQALFEWMAKGI